MSIERRRRKKESSKYVSFFKKFQHQLKKLVGSFSSANALFHIEIKTENLHTHNSRA